MEQFIGEQMRLLQGLTASVQQIQQNQQNQQNQQHQNAPQARDKHRDFMSHHPPTFSHSVDPFDADDWLKVIGKKLDIAQCNDRGRSYMLPEDSKVSRPTGGMLSLRPMQTQIL
jgi:hypothetical protein